MATPQDMGAAAHPHVQTKLFAFLFAPTLSVGAAPGMGAGERSNAGNSATTVAKDSACQERARAEHPSRSIAASGGDLGEMGDARGNIHTREGEPGRVIRSCRVKCQSKFGRDPVRHLETIDGAAGKATRH